MQGEKAGKGADRCSAHVPRADRIATVVFEVVEKLQDKRGVEVVDMQCRGFLARGLLDKVQQQTKGVTVARNGLRAHPLMVAQVLGKKRLDMGSTQRITRHHEIPPSAAEKPKRSAAAVRSSGVALTYQ